MKIFTAVALAFLTFLSDSIQAAQTAEGRMYCLSIRFNRANAGGIGAVFSLDLTGISAGINGELYPVFQQQRSHFSTLVLTDEALGGQFYGSMLLDVPTSDNDGDGFPDIFDTAEEFSGVSSGMYSFSGFASGNVTANWSRSADSHIGTCRITLQNFGEPFNHTFTIFEYKGPMTYTPGTNVVAATVDLTLTGIPDSELKGPISFTKEPSDPHNELDFVDGIWTNAIPETPELYSFLGDSLLRDPAWPTNYYSYFEFDDWLLNTAEFDYYLWVLSIDDLNDADADGIPDFSDDPETIMIRRPLLALARTESNLQLTISGDIGQVCEIQQSSTVDAISWPTISSVTLTNDPQTISLPLPPDGTAFWRVRIE